MTIKELGPNFTPEWRNDLNNNFKEISGMQDSVNDAATKAAAAEKIANEARTKADSADNISNSVQKQLDTIVINGDSSVEAAQARVALDGTVHENLKGHTDAIHTNLNNLEAKAFEQYTRKSKPMVMATFIDDDGKSEVWTKLKPIFETEGVPITLAIIDSWVNRPDCLTLDQILHLQNNLGWEMASHTINHVYLTQQSYETAKYEVITSKDNLAKKGLNIESIVYPFGDENETIHDLSRLAKYQCGVDTQEGVNTIPVETYKLKRIALGSYFATPSTQFPITSTFDGYYKPRIDEAITSNSWIIFKLHCASADHDENQQLYLKQCIKYLKENGVPIVNLRDGLNSFRNSVDFGSKSTGGNYTVIDPLGQLHSSQVASNLGGRNAKFETLLDSTIFPKNKVSYHYVVTSDAINFPEAKGGLLVTYHIPDYSFVFQLYHITQSNKVYKRYWNQSKNTWEPFVKISNDDNLLLKLVDNTVPGSHVISDLPNKVISVVAINTASAAGFPENAAGTLITDRNAYAGYDSQTYYVYNSNRIYCRKAKSDGTFLEWDELARKSPTKLVTADFGTVSAYWHVDFNTGIAAKTGDFSLLTPMNGKILDGINFTSYVNELNVIIIRAINYTATSRNVGSKDFRVSTIRAL